MSRAIFGALTRVRALPIATVFLCALWIAPLRAEVAIAVLDFELNDLTLLPRTPEEVERTASIRPMLETALRERSGFRLVSVDAAAAAQANVAFGYLFDHHEIAAQLGREYGADWIVVGRLHKPSFLFAYIMAHLIDAQAGLLAGNFIVEVKGPQDFVTGKGVERLAQKISAAIEP